MTKPDLDFVGTAEAAQILQRTPDTVRYYERHGLLAAWRVGGRRLFRRADVERLATERRRRQAPEPVRS
ncbi:MAG: helix-turn-helix domain-containing protein [Vicinamibacterales bacterium]